LNDFNEEKIIYNILNREIEIIYIKSTNIIWDISEILMEEKIEKNIFEWKIAWEYIKKISKNSGLDYKILKWWYFSDKRIIKNTLELEKINKAIKIIDKTFNSIAELNKNWELKWKTELQIRWIICK